MQLLSLCALSLLVCTSAASGSTVPLPSKPADAGPVVKHKDLGKFLGDENVNSPKVRKMMGLPGVTSTSVSSTTIKDPQLAKPAVPLPPQSNSPQPAVVAAPMPIAVH